MKMKKGVYLLLVILPMIMGGLVAPMLFQEDVNGTGDTRKVVLETGEEIELAPDEVLYTYRLSDAPTAISGVGDPLLGSEYGVRTDSFSAERMNYDSATQNTDTVNLSVPLGDGWEGYRIDGNVTSITENRTWVENSDFDVNANWTYYTHDEPSSFGPSYTNSINSQWLATGDASGGGCALFDLETGYYYDAGGGLYGYWYDVGDKAYAVQNLTIPRGEVTSLGLSVDYWADINWGILTGFFEVFVSIGDPDNGGTYLWQKAFDAMGTGNSANWLSSGYVEVEPGLVTLPDVNLWLGLRTTALEWWRPDVQPRARMDNLVIYVTAKATPEDVNLQMNGVNVQNVLDGGTPLFGLGTVSFTPSTPWRNDFALANFSWTPTPNPPDPDLDINIDIDADLTAYARRYNVDTISDTEFYTTGENYYIENSTDVNWDTNFYVAIPTGYDSEYSFNISIPYNRDIYHVGAPQSRTTNLLTGWNLGDPGDEAVNVSAYATGAGDLNGFWFLKGTSPNMITNIEVWDEGSSLWTRTMNFRANDITRFDATLPADYESDVVYFDIYDSNGQLWTSLLASVDATGHATTGYVTLDAFNSSVGSWEVHAYVNDEVSNGTVHNVGYFSRGFSITHSTNMAIKYPLGSESSWTVNLTYGELFLLQVRVNDSDNGELLAGGTMTYDWSGGSGSVNDMGTGEYSVTLDTGTLPSNGHYIIDLTWDRSYFDTLARQFHVNVMFTTNLLSSDAPGVDVPLGYDAVMDLRFEDQVKNPIPGAIIVSNWTYDDYSVTPVIGKPGHYTLLIETQNVPIGNYPIRITATKDFYEQRTIILSVQVRELHTSAIPSTSQLSLPVGYSTSFTITYTDTDHSIPISGFASSISCNWSDIHQAGDQNYTVVETVTPGLYEVTLFSKDLDILQIYDVEFHVDKYGAQNQTFIVTVELRTHLTSFFLVDPVSPTPYTGNIEVLVSYFDVDTATGIENGSLVGYNVLITLESPSLPGIIYTVVNGTNAGEYLILIPAEQWGTIGPKVLIVYADWIGPTVKYSDEVLSTSVNIIGTPTDIFLGESPSITQYGENISFTVIYYDVAGDTGVVNSTGPFAGNVLFYIEILTTGQSLTPADISMTEIDPVSRPGEYQIEFDTSLLSGIIGCELRIWFNWTAGQLPLYENQTLLVTVFTTYRQTTVSWSPLPVTPYDELVNMSLNYRDVSTASIILNSPSLDISIQEAITYTLYYDGDITGVFKLEIDTSSWTPGTHVFHIDVVWTGNPFYQNRTSIAIPITVRMRYTELSHSSYAPVQFDNSITIRFTYLDLDDYSSTNMDGGTFTLDAALSSFYSVDDNGDGTYDITLNILEGAFPSTGIYIINASILYGGTPWRYAEDATDFFYLTVTQRRTQLTSDLPDPAPYLTQALITVYYSDDNNDTGITNANVYASCATAIQELELGINYQVQYISNGEYHILINTTALGTFGSYSIVVTANYTGAPFYLQRIRTIVIEVSRRPTSLTVSKSPLNTPFAQNVTFEITIEDTLDSSGIDLDKSKLIVMYSGSILVLNSEYSLLGSNGVYTISINSTLLTSVLVSGLSLQVSLFWGDVEPFYANDTTSTQVTVVSRFTQVEVLSTPGAFIFSNATALFRYSDYLTTNPISGAEVDLACLNTTSFDYWVYDMLDGRYQVLVDTSTLATLGKYYFTANFTWVNQTGLNIPYYQNITLISFSLTINPVSTALNFELISTTVFLGDTIYANVTFINILTGKGIAGSIIMTDWVERYGTSATWTFVSDGIYNLTISTSSLDAQLYSFEINATAGFHQNRTITADVLISSLPINIEVSTWPETPVWGDILVIQANVTDTFKGLPLIGAQVNLTISGTLYTMIEVDDGLYNATIPAEEYDAGEYSITIIASKLNHETRQRTFQIRYLKLDPILIASLDEPLAVSGQSVVLRADYLLDSDSSPITVGQLTFSWQGKSGILNWDSVDEQWIGSVNVADVQIGTYQILVQASSTNYKSASYQVTLEVREANTQLRALNDQNIIVAVSGDDVEITVYFNNTDLNSPITNATVFYDITDAINGSLLDIGGGYYAANISTTSLEILDWVLTVSAIRPGFSFASLQFEISISKIPTEVVVIGDALIIAYYGENVTYYFEFNDAHNGIGIENATPTFTLETETGFLDDLGDGEYSLTLNTSVVASSITQRKVYITFIKGTQYRISYVQVGLIVEGISTEIIGEEEVDVPIGFDYTQMFSFRDTIHDILLGDANATARWEFGWITITSHNNGSYSFGPADTGLERLDVRSEPYEITIRIFKANYSVSELKLYLTIRQRHTQLIVVEPNYPVYAGTPFEIRLTYVDTDSNIGILDAINTTETSGILEWTAYSNDLQNGTYIFGFVTPSDGLFELTIGLSKTDYETSFIIITVFSTVTPEQQAIAQTFQYLGIAVILGSMLAAAWFRHFSIPPLLRKTRRMVSALRGGTVPSPANVRSRRAMILDVMNDDLKPLHISKTFDDISSSTVDVSVLDVDQLLGELQQVVGLTEDDIVVLRRDLDKMRPSDRAGFLGEVLKQERSRRAREIAEAKLAEDEGPDISIERKLSDEEIEDIRNRLLKMGIEPDEVEIMVEQAKNLSKAEIEALLDQIGGGEE